MLYLHGIVLQNDDMWAKPIVWINERNGRYFVNANEDLSVDDKVIIEVDRDSNGEEVLTAKKGDCNFEK